VKLNIDGRRSAAAVHRGFVGTPATEEESENSLALAHLTRSAADLGWRSRRRGEVYLPRLGFSRQEADAIAAVTPLGQAFEALDFEASRATALGSNLANYRVVHFATHALLNSKHPELSGLVFSLVDEHGKPQNGFLDLEDIYNLHLPAELVVLSACETGLGKEISGEGLVGLTRGFMYAGASRVMASLWKIDDRATAELMRHFYQAMVGQGMRPAAALRLAQLRLQKDKRWSSPYFWAAFQIQGEWK
jgi:CHAT domain-containing protein